jgi:protein-glucosylgalactosylhydroxylysine glucosidase
MEGPISPPPVNGGAGDELPAYMSNGVVGLKIRDNPLTPGMALLSGFSGEHPERKIEAAAYAPYPLAGDICLGGTWMSVYCGPVLRHSAEPIQAANFRSAVAF